jgi:tagaturonate reductase
MMKVQTPIFQFGTSRFLQAHADLMISEALARGEAVGPITVVQSSGDPKRAERLSALARPEGFPVHLCGLISGERIDRIEIVTSVRRVLSTVCDWDVLTDLFVSQARIVLSNTGDTGFAPSPADISDHFDQSMSYPAKLRLLLRERYRHGAVPLTVMPMELVSRNGEVLKNRVEALSSQDDAGFRNWLDHDVIWANSIVDRIVSEPLEPAGAVAEPYALWAIEKQPGLTMPCRHNDIFLVGDLRVFEARKLFLLNLPHTLLAQRWRSGCRNEADTVGEMMADAGVRDWMESIIGSEVIPAFGRGAAEANEYWRSCVERFLNPYLDHRVADIAQNHREKVKRRVGGFLKFSRETGVPANCPNLSAIYEQMKTAR